MAVLALLWGSAFLWIKLALTGLSPVQVTVLRSALGAAVLLVLARVGGHRLPRDPTTWRHLAVAAFFCNALPFALFSLGERTADSGVAGVLNATTPLWSLLIGLVTGSERGTGPARLGGLALGFAGVLVMFAPWRHGGVGGWGALALLAAAASYPVAFVYMGRNLVGRGAPLAVSAAQLLAATGWSALALPVGGPWQPTWLALGAVLALGVLGTGFTFVLNYRLIQDEGATTAATVGYLLPVVSVGLGALVLAEPLTARVVLGALVVLAGVALTRWRARTPQPEPVVVSGTAPRTPPSPRR